jgi:hypothetical protein
MFSFFETLWISDFTKPAASSGVPRSLLQRNTFFLASLAKSKIAQFGFETGG